MAEFVLRERAFQFSVSVLKFFSAFDFSYDFRFVKTQLFRSCTSIGVNIIEGSAGSSKKTLIQFYRIALRSAHETTYWLRLIKEVFPQLDQASIQLQILESEAISKILGKSIITLQNKSD